MATKTDAKKTAKAPAKAAKATKAVKAPATKAAKAAPVARGPKADLAKKGSKDSVVSSLATALTREGETADQLKAKLSKVSNSKLLHLASVVEAVNKKFGSRAKLITAIAEAKKAGKDKIFVAKLGTLPLPQLLDMGLSATSRA